MTRAAPRPLWRRWRVWFSVFVVAPAVLWFAGGIVVAVVLTQPRNRPVAARTEIAGHAVEPAAVVTADGLTVRGWLARSGGTRARVVVLVTGVAGTRSALVERAAFYLEHGWDALLVDLRGTGESDPARISMGWHEALDLRAWHAWLAGTGYDTIAAHGQSLGAAAVVYAGTDTGWAFVVLEACYRDIDSALQNRVPWVPAPDVSLWPMHLGCQWLLGIDRRELRPVDAIRALRMPTLLVCGDADRSVGEGLTEDLFAASGARVKQLQWIGGAGHVDLWAYDRAAMRALMARWLEAGDNKPTVRD